MSWITGWRRRIALAGAVALVGAGAVVLPTTFAAGDLGTGDTLGTAGLLRLHLGAADYFRFDPTGGGASTQTNIAPTTGCKVALANSSLVSVTVTPSNTGALGLVADGLGVRQNNEGNGSPCGQVNGTGQSITIALAGDLASKTVDHAELDIEGKFNVIVRAQMFADGTLVGTATKGTGTASDSGPDSGDLDNYRFEFGDGLLFNKVKLSVDPSTPNGAFSLEGGADGTAPGTLGSTLSSDQNDSIFQISDAEGVLDCGGTATETGSTGEPDATLERLSNSDCKKVPYNFESSSDADSQDVHFGKDLSDQPDASFLVDIDWDNEPAQYPLPAVQVTEGSDPSYTPEWCDGTPASPSLPADYTGTDKHWCVRSESAESAGTGEVHRKTSFYGKGDPTLRLPLG